MKNSTAFISTLYSPPNINDDYFRDELPPHLTRDFAFLGALIANWNITDNPIYLYYKNDKTLKMCFRFKNDNGGLIAPLSKEKLENKYDDFQLRPLSYLEIKKFFISRYFQYKILMERQKLRKNRAIYYDLGSLSAVQSEFINHDEILSKLMYSVIVPHFQGEEKQISNDSNIAYCILDGWIEPKIEHYIGQGEVGIKYLLCPHCNGNLDYTLTSF